MPRNEQLIPDTLTRENIITATDAYDSGVEHDFHDSTKFDVLVKEKRYPPKAILALGARQLGVDLHPSDFTGGLGSKCFRILESLDFEIVSKQGMLIEHDFEVGHVYDRRTDIHSKHGGQQQRGTSTPGSTLGLPAVIKGSISLSTSNVSKPSENSLPVSAFNSSTQVATRA